MIFYFCESWNSYNRKAIDGGPLCEVMTDNIKEIIPLNESQIVENSSKYLHMIFLFLITFMHIMFPF